jgi:hypothetical protein
MYPALGIVRRIEMRTLRLCLGLLGILVLASRTVPAGAQPVGSEFQINTHTPGVAPWGASSA